MIMNGIFIFLKLYFNLSEKYRNKILGNIFKVDNVSVSGIFLIKEGVVFRLFSNGIFYQYSFKLGRGKDSFVFDDRIVSRIIFVDSYIFDNENDPIYWLIKILLCDDEHLVYQIVRMFL